MEREGMVYRLEAGQYEKRKEERGTWRRYGGMVYVLEGGQI